MPDDAKLVEVKIKPYYGNFMILCTIETESVSVTEDRPFMAGIDFGVDNTAAIVTNEGYALLFQGGALKSANQHFNKGTGTSYILYHCRTQDRGECHFKTLKESFHAP